MTEKTLSNTILATANKLYNPIIFVESMNGINLTKLSKQAKAEIVNMMVKGHEDITCYLPENKTLHIELKLPTNYQQQNQKDYQKRLESLGHKYFVCKSYESFFEVVNSELSLEYRLGLYKANRGVYSDEMLKEQFNLKE